MQAVGTRLLQVDKSLRIRFYFQMFKRGTYRSFHTAPAVMALVLLQQCHLTNPSEVCVPSASCSCSTDFNNRVNVTCQVESLTNLTSSIRKPDEVHQLYVKCFCYNFTLAVCQCLRDGKRFSCLYQAY